MVRRHRLERLHGRDVTRPCCCAVLISEPTLLGVRGREREAGIRLIGIVCGWRRLGGVLRLVGLDGVRLGLLRWSNGARRADWCLRHCFFGGPLRERKEGEAAEASSQGVGAK